MGCTLRSLPVVSRGLAPIPSQGLRAANPQIRICGLHSQCSTFFSLVRSGYRYLRFILLRLQQEIIQRVG